MGVEWEEYGGVVRMGGSICPKKFTMINSLAKAEVHLCKADLP